MRLTKRGKIVVGLLIAVAVYLVSTKVWWVGDHWCLGDVIKCYEIEGEVK